MSHSFPMPLSREMQPCNRQSSAGAAVSPSLSHHGMALHPQSKSSCPSFATLALNLLVKLLVKLLIRVGLRNSIVFRNYLSDAETMPSYSEIKLAVLIFRNYFPAVFRNYSVIFRNCSVGCRNYFVVFRT